MAFPFSIGQTASLSKEVTDADVRTFAQISLDDNPVHLDDTYAAGTVFGRRIAHGMLSAGLISAVIGTRLPGNGSIYLGQTLAFKKPVYLGETVTATVTISAIREEKAILTLDTVCTNAAGEVVLEGVATVKFLG